LARNVAVSDEK